MNEELKNIILTFVSGNRKKQLANILRRNDRKITDYFNQHIAANEMSKEMDATWVAEKLFNMTLSTIEQQIIADLVMIFSKAIKFENTVGLEEAHREEEKATLITRYIKSTNVYGMLDECYRDVFMESFKRKHPSYFADDTDTDTSTDSFGDTDSENRTHSSEDDIDTYDVGFCESKPPRRSQFNTIEAYLKEWEFYVDLEDYPETFNLNTPNGFVRTQVKAIPYTGYDIVMPSVPPASSFSPAASSVPVVPALHSSKPGANENIDHLTNFNELSTDEVKVESTESKFSADEPELDSPTFTSSSSPSNSLSTSDEKLPAYDLSQRVTTKLKSQGVFNGSRSMLELPSIEVETGVDPFAGIPGIITLSA